MSDSSNMSYDRCRFCSEVIENSASIWNEEIIRDGTVRVLPSKGAIVSPWLLLIPQLHVPSTALLPLSEKYAIARLLKLLRHRASSSGHNLMIFENGSPFFGAKVSCGIDHAHIHVLELKFDLVKLIRSHLPELYCEHAPWALNSYVPATPYIYIDDGISSHYFDASSTESQFVRKLIASEIGCGSEFHYDLFPRINNILSTISCFRKLLEDAPKKGLEAFSNG